MAEELFTDDSNAVKPLLKETKELNEELGKLLREINLLCSNETQEQLGNNLNATEFETFDNYLDSSQASTHYEDSLEDSSFSDCSTFKTNDVYFMETFFRKQANEQKTWQLNTWELLKMNLRPRPLQVDKTSDCKFKTKNFDTNALNASYNDWETSYILKILQIARYVWKIENADKKQNNELKAFTNSYLWSIDSRKPYWLYDQRPSFAIDNKNPCEKLYNIVPNRFNFYTRESTELVDAIKAIIRRSTTPMDAMSVSTTSRSLSPTWSTETESSQIGAPFFLHQQQQQQFSSDENNMSSSLDSLDFKLNFKNRNNITKNAENNATTTRLMGSDILEKLLSEHNPVEVDIELCGAIGGQINNNKLPSTSSKIIANILNEEAERLNLQQLDFYIKAAVEKAEQVKHSAMHFANNFNIQTTTTTAGAMHFDGSHGGNNIGIITRPHFKQTIKSQDCISNMNYMLTTQSGGTSLPFYMNSTKNIMQPYTRTPFMLPNPNPQSIFSLQLNYNINQQQQQQRFPYAIERPTTPFLSNRRDLYLQQQQQQRQQQNFQQSPLLNNVQRSNWQMSNYFNINSNLTAQRRMHQQPQPQQQQQPIAPPQPQPQNSQNSKCTVGNDLSRSC